MSETEKKLLFDDSGTDDDDDSKLKINKSYAQRYDEWREAEIKKKLEDRYGNLDEQLSSSSSDDDDEPQELDKALSKDFFEVISRLKKKDPKIYNPEVRFFNEEDQPSTSQDKKKKEKPIYLRDYERKLIVERGGVLSDDESDEDGQRRPASPSLAEKERSLKESLSKIVHSDSDNADDGLLTKKIKTAEEKKKEEEDYLEWLRGRKEELEDKSLQESLSHLREEWSNPNLDDGEKFLRDYILNKRYLGGDSDNVDTGNVTDEDYQDEYMDEFERKYNFRFEEPDSEFLKRYPRTIDSSVRKTDDRRKRHREDVKKRKEEEKLRQREELKVLKSLKRKEILKKIEKIKEITGNAELGISDKDLEEDYDPEEHDRRMNELFNDDYYKEGDDEMALEDLPLPPLEDDLADDYENWDEYEGGEEVEEPHCEDPDFNMDCDYDPEAARLAKEAQPKSSRERRKLKRQSRFGTLVRKKKPQFDPDEKTFQQYVDEYYGIDYEDIVGGQPCRFKYRKVVPNSFGLTVDEILAADDKELNAWVSIRKATALRPDHVEWNEKRIYELKAQNEALKRKILPSLYRHEMEDNEENEEGSRSKKKTKKKKSVGSENDANPADETGRNDEDYGNPRSKKKKIKKSFNVDDYAVETGISEGKEDRTHSKKKKKCQGEEDADVDAVETGISEGKKDRTHSKKKKKCQGEEDADADGVETGISEGKEDRTHSKKKKKCQGEEDADVDGIETGSSEEKEARPRSKKKKKSLGRGNTDGESGIPEIVNLKSDIKDRLNSKKKKSFSGGEDEQSQKEYKVSPLKKKHDEGAATISDNDPVSSESPKKKQKKSDRAEFVSMTSKDDPMLKMYPKKKKKSTNGLGDCAEDEEGSEVETGRTAQSEPSPNQSQKLSRRQRKNSKKFSKNAAPNSLLDSSENRDKSRVGKKRPAEAMDGSTNDMDSSSKRNSQKTGQSTEISSRQPKKRKLDNEITETSSEKRNHRNGNEPKSSNQKEKVSQNAVISTGKINKRRGKDRKRLHLLQKYGGVDSRNVEAENKARAGRKQNNKPVPVLGSMSDSRLKAYGLNPKKFKNKLKYA